MANTEAKKTKVCVIGGGAIGCHIAGHIARSGGAHVTVVDHKHKVAAIRKNGIRVITPSEDFTVRVDASDDASTVGVQDYVIVALKIQQLPGALDDIAKLIGPDTTVLPPSTGIPFFFFHKLAGKFEGATLPEVDPDGSLARTIRFDQVLPMVFWYGAHAAGDGVSQQDGDAGRYPIGELDGRVSHRAQHLSDLMAAGGLRAPVTANIRGEIWIKFANSLCGNPIAVLTLADMDGFASSPQVLGVFEAALAEVDAIADVFGVHIPLSIADRMAFTLGTHDHKFSMLQDLEAGRELELGPFADSLDAVKRLSGCSTPTLDVVLPLTKLRNVIHQKRIASGHA